MGVTYEMESAGVPDHRHQALDYAVSPETRAEPHGGARLLKRRKCTTFRANGRHVQARTSEATSIPETGPMHAHLLRIKFERAEDDEGHVWWREVGNPEAMCCCTHPAQAFVNCQPIA